ncbi:MAG: hypothetical protein ACI4T8_02455 [Christensenellales bacterium]
METKKIKSDIHIVQYLMVVTAIFCFFAVYFIVVGARKDNLTMIVGGSVFFFVGIYGEFIFAKRLVKIRLAMSVGRAIEFYGLRSISAIAKNLNKSERVVAKGLVFLMENNYLLNYTVEKDTIINTTKETKLAPIESNNEHLDKSNSFDKNDGSKTKIETTASCSGCGAILSFVGKSKVCPYCGRLVKSK